MSPLPPFDAELLQRLSAADIAAPVPAGGAITPETLRAHHARQQRQRRIAVATAMLLGALPWLLLRDPPVRHDIGELPAARLPATTLASDVTAELQRLIARLDRLREQTDELHRTAAAGRADAADEARRSQQRCELAMVRASALLDAPAALPPLETHR